MPATELPVAQLAVAQLQGQAIVAAAVRADLDQVPQAALQPGELAEQVADLGQREAEPPGPADERQPPAVVVAVLAESGSTSGAGRESRPRRW